MLITSCLDLDIKELKGERSSGSVRTLTSWFELDIGSKWKSFCCNFSQTRWQSCCVLYAYWPSAHHNIEEQGLWKVAADLWEGMLFTASLLYAFSEMVLRFLSARAESRKWCPLNHLYFFLLFFISQIMNNSFINRRCLDDTFERNLKLLGPKLCS